MSSFKYNRREFMKKAASATLLTMSVSQSKVFAKSKKQPNVLFIICDQMRADALSCLGHPNARTPNLDKMAEKGVLFENFFVNNPVCAPSRITFFTGLYPHQTDSLTNKTSKFIQSLDDCMLGYFRNRNYKLGWIGKNHTGTKSMMQELDVWNDRGRDPFRAYSKFVPPYWHSDTLWPKEKCNPGMNTRDAVDFINKSKDEPFFLHVSYFDPHPPYMAASEFAMKYNTEDMVIPPYIAPKKLSPRFEEHVRALHYDKMKDSDLKETLRYYYASIEWGVDYQVGQIMDALEKNNLTDNTIVVFTSDHGDFMGEHRMVRKAMFNYDALLHVPFIVHAPGHFKKGIRAKNIAQSVDLFPTLIDITNGKWNKELPGRSLVPFLKGESVDEPDFTIFASAAYSDLPDGYFDNPEPAYNPDSNVPFHTRVERITWKDTYRTIMARTLKWKLILNESRPTELYKMDGGYIEKENVAEKPEYAEIRAKLEKKVKSLWKWT